jgi:oligogalacturonide lyase
MIQARPPGRGWSRRTFLAFCSLLRLPAASEKGRVFPSETRRYLDPTTEFVVFRFTDPAHASFLPGPANHCVSGRGNFLLYASDRTGSAQAYRMDLKSGQSWLITEAEALEPSSLVLFPDERHIAYFDGRALFRVSLRNYKSRRLYEIPPGFERGEDLAIASDGRRAVFVEVAGTRSRLRLNELRSGRTETVLEWDGVLRRPLLRPKSDWILFRAPDEALWVVDVRGRNRRRLALAEGKAGPALFSRDGDTLLYLNYPADPKQLHTLREYALESGQDTLIAKTTQFVAFAANRNASVFVGASGAKATPYVLLLLRVTGRELTLCEHKAARPDRIRLTFSPDSRWVFFESDRDGKPAIYGLQLSEFVENTDG